MEFTPNTAGVWHGLDAKIYHAAPGLSNSMLKSFARSPAHFKAEQTAPREQTPAMELGTLCHSLLFTPTDPFVILPDKKRPTSAQLNAAKPAPETTDLINFWKAWDAANAGKVCYSQSMVDQAKAIVAAVRSHPRAQEALKSGQAEVSLFQHFSYGGTVLRKARLDWVTPGSTIVDLKTVEDAREHPFGKACFDMGYYRQAAYYLDIWNDAHPNDRKENFVFIAVEKNPPFGINVFNLELAAIEKGRGENLKLIGRYIDCLADNRWPAYEDRIKQLALPAWAMKEQAA